MRILAAIFLIFSVPIAHAQHQHGGIGSDLLSPAPLPNLRFLDRFPDEGISPWSREQPSLRELLELGAQAKCEDVYKETRLSYPRMEHCRLHKYYQMVFPTSGCHCSTGQCRPTEFRRVQVTAANPMGIEIEVSGKWYAVPPEVLHHMVQGAVPQPLLEYDAHVCAYEEPNFEIECVWIRIMGENTTPGISRV